MGDAAREFGFPTLEAAAAAARDLAVADHRRHFVVEVGRDEVPVSVFGTVPALDLEALILRADAGAQRLRILRVATPDGDVEAVEDPGDLEGRLVVFCTSG